jgi:hypothetical protein
MSTQSMQQPFTKAEASFNIPPKTTTDLLIEASAILPADHVMVIGPLLSDHLVGLAHHGCTAAAGARPNAQIFEMADADVVWFTDVEDAGARMAEVLHSIGTPRLVAIEFLAADDLSWVQNVLRQLAGKGLVHCSYHRAVDRLIVTASRPDWLRWVA